MTRLQHRIVESWADVVTRAIRLGHDDAAYRLTRGFVRRCRELGLATSTEHARLICSWCNGTIRDGGEPTSHGICPACRDAHFPLHAKAKGAQ